MNKALPYSEEAYALLHQGAIVLAEVESNGIAIDEHYLRRTLAKNTRRIDRMEARIQNSEVWKVWKKAYGAKANLSSRPQLATVLFKKMGFESAGKTSGGEDRTDEEALVKIDHPFIRDYLEVAKLSKAVNTNIKGILREVVHGMVHCFFNLHTAVTYRSSSDSFNFQNIPVRDEVLARLLRRAFIARPGRQIVELDLKGAEVRVAACYHKDPRMIDYILDPTKDMHRDMAMECFLLRQEQVTKKTRYCGKNMFVFPQFYGDWYIDCARHLWDAIMQMHLTTAEGTPLLDHLRSKGIQELGSLDPDQGPEPGTFAHHIKQVERNFWEKRFPIYNQWKRRWYEAYRKQGWFKTLTGFICQGYMKRNEVINYPVQGSAFHCLLWTVIQLVRKELRKRKMKTLVVGQIHDSIVSDVVPSELDEYLIICRQLIQKEIQEAWKWLIVPLDMEAEVAPVGSSWADKAPYEVKE
jgi:DNA polymerase-1